MGPMGMSQQDMLKVHLAQAKGERKTLEGRIKVTKESIDTLESALHIWVAHEASSSFTDTLLKALVTTNLTQLKANLDEGMERIEYLDKSIKTMETQVSTLITAPGVLRKH